jgi:hypothetical protein
MHFSDPLETRASILHAIETVRSTVDSTCTVADVLTVHRCLQHLERSLARLDALLEAGVIQ